MTDILNYREYSKEEAKALNPLTLAFIGDAVYEVYIRTYILSNNNNLSVHKLHVKAIGFVKANAQYMIMKDIENQLTEEEVSIFKRGRNSKSGTVPKNADVREYRVATGFEAVIGYLYISRQEERLKFILDKAIEVMVKNWTYK